MSSLNETDGILRVIFATMALDMGVEYIEQGLDIGKHNSHHHLHHKYYSRRAHVSHRAILHGIYYPRTY